ncbi:electron transfer flavoprotein beta subunit [Paenibacillus harenae]|uniref:Electron transfer flavoprotein subunit beta n=1 Tax=Paenibacillus harenae TaxID=306543 RepID=A0ABT9U4T4_PAEHA|nr:electron transfer flavoprotein beta subunit [Paenibacillus harenae]
MLKIVVLLKQTFDTEEKIIVTGGSVDDSAAKFIINPYDEYALEEAIRLRDQHGGQVIAVTCGPERTQDALRTALAVGADEAIRLDDDGSFGDDGYAAAAALAALVKPLEPDLVLAGLFAVDSGAGSVALQVAERLGLPHASAAVKVSVIAAAERAGLRAALNEVDIEADRYALVERDVEGDTETVTIPLPALITAQQGLNEPRYPSLPGIMKAKRKPLRTVALSELAVNGPSTDAAAASLSPASDLSPRTVRTRLSAPPPRAAGKKLAGAPAEQASALTELLRTEAKLL